MRTNLVPPVRCQWRTPQSTPSLSWRWWPATRVSTRRRGARWSLQRGSRRLTVTPLQSHLQNNYPQSHPLGRARQDHYFPAVCLMAFPYLHQACPCQTSCQTISPYSHFPDCPGPWQAISPKKVARTISTGRSTCPGQRKERRKELRGAVTRAADEARWTSPFKIGKLPQCQRTSVFPTWVPPPARNGFSAKSAWRRSVTRALSRSTSPPSTCGRCTGAQWRAAPWCSAAGGAGTDTRPTPTLNFTRLRSREESQHTTVEPTRVHLSPLFKLPIPRYFLKKTGKWQKKTTFQCQTSRPLAMGATTLLLGSIQSPSPVFQALTPSCHRTWKLSNKTCSASPSCRSCTPTNRRRQTTTQTLMYKGPMTQSTIQVIENERANIPQKDHT